jgi:putative transposase
LRSRIPVERLILSPAEKCELLRIGAECGHDVEGLMEVAKPATYNRWLAQMRGGRPFQSVGRPRLTQELRDVVIRTCAAISPCWARPATAVTPNG